MPKTSRKIKKKIIMVKHAQAVQDRQDAIFRRMSAQEKIILTSSFFEFAKKLSNLNGTRETFTKARENF